MATSRKKFSREQVALANRIGVVGISDEETASIQRDLCVKLEAYLQAASTATDWNSFFDHVGIAFYGSEYKLADNVKRARKLKLRDSCVHPLTSKKMVSVFVGVGINQSQLLSMQEAEAIRYLIQATVEEIDCRLPSVKVTAISDTLHLLRAILLNLR
jgi:hypothetical protein